MSSIGMKDFPDDYVRYFSGGEQDELGKYYHHGWYFEDEINGYDPQNGPYTTRKLCLEALEEYAKSL